MLPALSVARMSATMGDWLVRTGGVSGGVFRE